MFTKRFLENVQYMYTENPPSKILYCYGVYQTLYDEMKSSVRNIEFHEGLPDAELIREFSEDKEHKLIVIDDLMHRAIESLTIELLFTQYCHHRCLSCIFIQQNMFTRGKHSKTIALNTWYTILFQNIRDKLQVLYLARQVYPGKSQVLMDAYSDATRRPYGYLVIDFSPNMDEKFRLRTDIFPDENMQVYIPTL